MVKYFIILIAILLFNSCTRDSVLSVPDLGNDSILLNASMLAVNTKLNIEGIYDVIEGNQNIGDKVVIKWTGRYLSIFSEKNDIYFVLKAGKDTSGLLFEGYWRMPISSTIGSVQLYISNKNVADSLLNTSEPYNINIEGKYFANNKVNSNLKLKLNHRFLNSISPFYIIAHRGGGRNVDRLPASENSIELMKLAEGFGANGIEIDVRLTKDNIPIIYHDDNFSTRLVNSDILIGPVSNYNYFQIENYSTLKQGEKIPTLEATLDTIINSTSLNLVWLDVKTLEVMDKIIPIQMKALRKAKDKGRDLVILLGLPTQELVDKFKTLDVKKQLQSVCEISYDETIATNSLVYAPRWTLGVPYDDGMKLHNENKYLFTWTLDQKEFILKYLREKIYDGILTNYPSTVAYQYYINK